MSRSLFATRVLVASFAAMLVFSPFARGAEKTKYPSFGKIERKDPRFDKLVPKAAHM